MKKVGQFWRYSVLLLGVFMMLASGCKKDESTPLPDGAVKDIDGNVYHTVTIGSQVWMVENLKTTKYRNGDPIANETNSSSWAKLNKGAYCTYNNNSSFAGKYGFIYNWHAVNDSRKLAPAGWHIPTQTDWNKLMAFVSVNPGTSGSVVKALAANTDWLISTAPNAVGNDLTKNNSTGFSALPGGIRGIDGPSGTFGWMGNSGWWWSANAIDADFGLAFGMFAADNGSLAFGQFFRTDGLSVRCIKD